MFGPLGTPEIVIIGIVIILIFGVGKLSGLGRDLGSSIKEFRRAVKDPDPDDQAATRTATTVPAPPPPPPPPAAQQPAPPPVQSPPAPTQTPTGTSGDPGKPNIF